MSAKFENLLDEVRRLEKEMTGEARTTGTAFCSRIHANAAQFTGTATAGSPHSRFLVLITSPIIWMCAIPIALADLAGTFYQAVCFPIYGIPKVRRADYLAFDRRHLGYLNFFEKVSCEYCAYVNGILAYLTEIAARTEQHYCPIKHAGCVKCAHSRYRKFFDYGDAKKYREQFEIIRRSFQDLESPGTSRGS